VSHIFFLQFADNRPWYILLHDSDVLQNSLDCSTVTIEPPNGGVSKFTTFAYDTVWVENIHSFFNAICGGISK